MWTHRKTTLYRYRSTSRTHALPVLLVFALINRPDIFDLRPGNSFVEFLLEEGFDVFLLDWGVPGDEDADMGLDNYVCDELPWAMRETLRASGQDELSLLGWCIGGTLVAMHAALEPERPGAQPRAADDAGRHLRLAVRATGSGATPSTPSSSPRCCRRCRAPAIDWANKMMKPVTNFWTTYRTLWQNVLEGEAKPRGLPVDGASGWPTTRRSRAAPTASGSPGCTRRTGSCSGALRLRGRRVDLRQIDQNLLVVTAGADHIAPRAGTLPLLDLVASEDVTHLDRPGGHIGLMAGSKAREEIWPDIAEWLEERSAR